MRSSLSDVRRRTRWAAWKSKPVRLMPCERQPEQQNRVQIIGAGTPTNSSLRESGPFSVRHLDWERIHDGYIDLLRGIVDRHAATTFASENVFFAPD
jgi:hypothetical protein